MRHFVVCIRRYTRRVFPVSDSFSFPVLRVMGRFSRFTFYPPILFKLELFWVLRRDFLRTAGDETRTHTPLRGRTVGLLAKPLLLFLPAAFIGATACGIFHPHGYAVLLIAGDFKSPTFI